MRHVCQHEVFWVHTAGALGSDGVLLLACSEGDRRVQCGLFTVSSLKFIFKISLHFHWQKIFLVTYIIVSKMLNGCKQPLLTRTRTTRRVLSRASAQAWRRNLHP